MADMRQQYIGQVLQGTYRIERLLGSGGMGAVYEASHLRLPRRFAVKLLFADLDADPQAGERFFQEAMLTNRLRHPHIVDVVHCSLTDAGEPYIVMELLQGESLRSRLERCERLPLEQAAQILRQVASALQSAHEQGIVHRDLKPGNIFLCDRSPQPDHVKVVDFGIAKILGSAKLRTRTEGFIGTPWYMAPERLTDRQRVDHRADIFSMGAIMYELLAGRPPFEGEFHVVLFHIAYRDHPPLETWVPHIPRRVSRAVSRALSKQPEDRFGSMNAFYEALVNGASVALSGSSPEEVDSGARCPRRQERARPAEQTFEQRRPDRTRRWRRQPCLDGQRQGSSQGPTEAPPAAGETTGKPATRSEDAHITEVRASRISEATTERDVTEVRATRPEMATEVEQAPSVEVTSCRARLSDTLAVWRSVTAERPISRRRVGRRTIGAVLVMLVLGGAAAIWTAHPHAGGRAAREDRPVVRPPAAPPPGQPSRAPRQPAGARGPARPRRAEFAGLFGRIHVGTVSVGVRVVAHISLDGVPRGRSPLLLQRVPVGSHVIRASSPGYQTVSHKLLIQPGETGRVILQLPPVRRRRFSMEAFQDWLRR